MLTYTIVTARTVTGINDMIGLHVQNGYYPSGPLIRIPGSFAQPMLLRTLEQLKIK